MRITDGNQDIDQVTINSVAVTVVKSMTMIVCKLSETIFDNRACATEFLHKGKELSQCLL